MNIQRVDDVVFLAYIAKYMTKPEPHGFLSDTAQLRAREEMSDRERFLHARVVGMPEAVHRTWGFKMRAGTNTVHLITKPPHKRMRAIPRTQAELLHAADKPRDSAQSVLQTERLYVSKQCSTMYDRRSGLARLPLAPPGRVLHGLAAPD